MKNKIGIWEKPYKIMQDNNPIIISLSGGGIRAMVFHVGVLRWLAESRSLENIKHISTVSGGSLLVGLIYSLNDMEWPTSEEFTDKISQRIKKILISSSIQSAALKLLLYPTNWKYLLSRANVLSKAISQRWGVCGSFSDIPSTPIWTINGTTAETGRRFRFKETTCGDYEIGYADASEFLLADVMATSAAFPIGIGPYVINTSDHRWKKKNDWGKNNADGIALSKKFKRLHIYDGGVYDNLGIEPLFDIGSQMIKRKEGYLIVSDAGSPLERIPTRSVLNPFRSLRIANIALDQTRALRVRSFVNYLKKNNNCGQYLQIGTNAIDKINSYKSHNINSAENLLKDIWLSNEDVLLIEKYPTTLNTIKEANYVAIERHGYETAKWNFSLFST